VAPEGEQQRVLGALQELLEQDLAFLPAVLEAAANMHLTQELQARRSPPPPGGCPEGAALAPLQQCCAEGSKAGVLQLNGSPWKRPLPLPGGPRCSTCAGASPLPPSTRYRLPRASTPSTSPCRRSPQAEMTSFVRAQLPAVPSEDLPLLLRYLLQNATQVGALRWGPGQGAQRDSFRRASEPN
jgi:hypothetical protein